MVQREKLIEILQNAPRRYMSYDEYADYLLDNGVIVPPCKVGTKVYYPDCENDRVFLGEICSYSIDAAHSWFNCHYDVGLNMWYSIEGLGKTVFLSREEAEAALKGADDGKAD